MPPPPHFQSWMLALVGLEVHRTFWSRDFLCLYARPCAEAGAWLGLSGSLIWEGSLSCNHIVPTGLLKMNSSVPAEWTPPETPECVLTQQGNGVSQDVTFCVSTAVSFTQPHLASRQASPPDLESSADAPVLVRAPRGISVTWAGPPRLM